MFRNMLALVCLFGFVSGAFGYSGNWTGVASDDSGKYLAASSSAQGNYPGNVFISTDYGTTWTAEAPTFPWMAVASDASGKMLAAAGTCYPGGSCGSPYMSTDGGQNWATSAGFKNNYYGIGSDSSGQRLIAVAGGNVYGSGDGGASWGVASGLQSGYADNVAAYSGDGSTRVVSYMEYITVNNNANNLGWVQTPTVTARWRGVSTDYTGKVIAGAYDLRYGSGGNYESGFVVSTDGGASYTTVKLTNEGEKYYSVSVNDNANYVFCGGSNGIYVYNIAKKTVTQSAAPAGGYYSIASSKDGKYVIASSGSLYHSSDYGATFQLVK